MKKNYSSPQIEIMDVQVESLLVTGSISNTSSLGSTTSKWSQDGYIINDNGSGPGYSGAKKFNAFDEIDN